MNISLKIFPISDLNNSTTEMVVELTDGKLSEVLDWVEQKWEVNPYECAIMVLCNGQSLDLEADFDLSENDKVWIMPRLSGG